MTPIEIASIMVKLKAGWTVIPQPVKSFFITRAKDTLMKGLGLDAISKAHETATERFLELFIKQLEVRGPLRRAMIPIYQDALVIYCDHEAAQGVLIQPFDGESPLDSRRLAILWEEIRDSEGEALPPLPSEFSWTPIAEPYQKAVIQIMTASPELRPILELAQQRQTADNTGVLAGPKLKFDEAGYREALLTRYGRLRLGDIGGDWSKYQLRLQSSIFTFHKVRRKLCLQGN